LSVAVSAPRPVGSEVAYNALRNAIIEGEFRPGERIIEQRPRTYGCPERRCVKPCAC
jgi:hypothetical protein